MPKYILAIDQGTTGTTTLLFDRHMQLHGKATVEFPQHFPEPSWVEHDLDEIWASVAKSVRKALAQKKVKPSDIAAIGITNQRETTCLWHRGKEAHPACRAIVWQDRRTAAACARLKKRGLERVVHRKTGLLLDPYFSATKLSWMLENVSGLTGRARGGEIAFGTIESYLLYRMSGGTAHATDVTNASRTLLMNLKTCEWDDDLLKLFRIPRALLPEIKPSAVEYGRTKSFLDIPDGTPITGMAGDQQAALFGQACFQKGNAKCTYGTGAFALVNTGHAPVYSKHRLLSSVAWKLGDDITYCLEGSCFIAGAAVQWLRDGLKLFPQSADVEALAGTVPDADGVYFVPALSGFGAPHWEPAATGLLTGITRRTTKAHVARATLEGIGYQVAELLEAMGKDLGRRVSPLRVDGGASADGLLMQFQADLLRTEVVRSSIAETTALGAGLQAGLAIGFWSDLDDIQKSWKAAESFHSTISSKERKLRMERWGHAVSAVKQLAHALS